MFNSDVHLWLDLEATIVNAWDDPTPINDEIISKWIQDLKPVSVGIFSFAIWDDNDRADFNKRFKQSIEDRFKITLTDALIPTKNELFEFIKNSSQKQFDFMDFCDFWTKESAFIDWTKCNGTTNILIDDMVEDSSHLFKNAKVSLFNINTLAQWDSICK